MKASDVTATLDLALQASGCGQAQARDCYLTTGSSYVSGERAEWLEDHAMKHIRGTPYHHQTQSKTERWH